MYVCVYMYRVYNVSVCSGCTCSLSLGTFSFVYEVCTCPRSHVAVYYGLCCPFEVGFVWIWLSI